MNVIDIIAPRWHDRRILIADWKLGVMNKIVVRDKRIPLPLYISGKEAMQYPVETKKTRTGSTFKVRAIPIDACRTVEEDEQNVHAEMGQ